MSEQVQMSDLGLSLKEFKFDGQSSSLSLSLPFRVFLV